MKRLYSIMTIILAFVSLSVSALADTQKNGWSGPTDGWYYWENGVAKTGWFEDGGNWYYLYDGVMEGDAPATVPGYAAEGYMLSDTFFLADDGAAYYFGADGAMIVGEKLIDNYLYRFDSKGRLQEGWVTIRCIQKVSAGDDISDASTEVFYNRYYYQDGAMCGEGWLSVGKDTYYITADCKAQIGWANIDGNRYYFQEDGKLLADCFYVTPEGYCYYLEADGKMVTGDKRINARDYDFGDDGKLKSGWVMLRDSFNIDGEYYSTTLYYYFEDSVLRTGFCELGEYYFYFMPSAAEVSGSYVVNDQEFLIAENGGLEH